MPQPILKRCLQILTDTCYHTFQVYPLPYFFEGKIELTPEEGIKFVKGLHQFTHLGVEKMMRLIKNSRYQVPNLKSVAQKIIDSCKPCAFTNATRAYKEPGKRQRGDRPGVYWEVDFTEVKPGMYGNKYLLVFVDTFSGWVEAFPTKTAEERKREESHPVFPAGLNG